MQEGFMVFFLTKAVSCLIVKKVIFKSKAVRKRSMRYPLKERMAVPWGKLKGRLREGTQKVASEPEV